MDLIGDHPSIRTISERIVERSGGNPFFAEELIRSLVDSGELDGRPGDYEAVGRPLAEMLPATVQTVIGARIDRLLPADKEVLQIGATIGREFPLSVLAEVTRSTAHDLAGILGRLSRLELVQGAMSEDEQDRFAFRHPLIQEVAYAMQLRTRRVELHSAVAKALERFHHNQLSEYADLIAYHYEAARDFASAAVYTARAATWIATTNSRLALKLWQKVHLLLQSQPRSPQIDRLRLKASGQIMNSAWREGVSAEEVAPYAKEALDLVREMKDSVSEVLMLVVYGRISACTGSADDYVKQVLQAIDLSDATDPSIRTLLQVFLCQACGYAGKLREGLQASDTALAHIADITKSHEAKIGFNVERWVESLRARLLVRMGNFAAASQSIGKLTSSEKDHPDPAVQFIPHLAGVELAWLTQDRKLADLHSIRIDEIAASSRIPYVAVYAAVCKALVLSLSGNHVAAIQKLESAIRLATEAYAGMEYQSEMLAFLAEIHLRSNSPTAAFRVAERGIAVARERHARLAECRSTIILALVLSEGKLSHPNYQASDLIARARRLIEETGALPYESLLAAAQPTAASCG
jgi:tetratricopeptide (TPR) repeat protein